MTFPFINGAPGFAGIDGNNNNNANNHNSGNNAYNRPSNISPQPHNGFQSPYASPFDRPSTTQHPYGSHTSLTSPPVGPNNSSTQPYYGSQSPYTHLQQPQHGSYHPFSNITSPFPTATMLLHPQNQHTPIYASSLCSSPAPVHTPPPAYQSLYPTPAPNSSMPTPTQTQTPIAQGQAFGGISGAQSNGSITCNVFRDRHQVVMGRSSCLRCGKELCVRCMARASNV